MKNAPSAHPSKKFIHKQLQEIKRQSKGIVSGKDIECLHDVRVATRRLRSAFWVFKQKLSSHRIEQFRESLRAFAKATGSSRDLDVHIALVKKLKADKKSQSCAQGLDIFVELLEDERQQLQPRVISALERLHKEKTLAKIQEALDEVSQSSTAEALSGFYAMGETKITKCIKSLRKHEYAVGESHNVKGLHRLRIAAKKLRYTVESFEPIFGKEVFKYRGAAHRLQRILGALHDSDVRIALLPDLVKQHKNDTAFLAATDYLHSIYKVRRNRAYKELVEYWKKLKEEKTWKRLSECVSSFHKEPAHPA